MYTHGDNYGTVQENKTNVRDQYPINHITNGIIKGINKASCFTKFYSFFLKL